jgi:aminomethyltransferase
LKKTPLYEKHVALGAKLIDFGGWMMPLQYSGILEEHRSVRTTAGLFDVSHMGEILVKGPEAAEFIQKMITNDISRLHSFQILYSPMCYPSGGIVDDVLIYKLNAQEYLLVVNAANIDKDFKWLKEHQQGGVTVQDVSPQYAQLALQGPLAQDILQKLTDVPLNEIRFFRFKDKLDIAGVQALVSRTGYTGEDGFEMYIPIEKVLTLWDSLMQAGEEYGLVPAGLGARDTLRFEVALPLYGQELSEEISPLEAGLDKFVKLGKEDFVGRDVLIQQREQGVPRKLVGFEMIDRGIPRHNYEVRMDERSVGYVTSGSFSPSLNKNLGLALVDSRLDIETDTQIEIVVRRRLLKAKITKTPFYVKQYKK